MLPLVGVPASLLQSTWEKSSSLDIEPFLVYDNWCLSEGRPLKRGFEWEVLRTHDPARSASQRKQDFASDVPIDRQISAQEHLVTALSLQHPFGQSPRLEQDLQFAIQSACQYGLQVARYRDVAFGHLRKLDRALLSLDAHLLASRPVHHVDGFRPAMFAAVISILKWPDRELLMKLVQGFELVGDIPKSHIFRPIPSPPQPAVPLLGQDAQRYVDGLEKDLRVHPRADVILQETLKEQSLGLAGPFRDRAFFDNLSGKGAWRPLKRHVIHQHDKDRPIDDGKAGRRNECSQLVETIVNQHADFPAAVLQFWAQTARQLLREVQPETSPHDLFRMVPWLHIAMGTDDMWKGYRQLHACAAHAAVSVVTFVHPHTKQRVYSQLYGLPFGLASAVVQFNRAPQVLTATLRRVLFLVCGHYFDDTVQFECSSLASCTKTIFVRTMSLFGVKLGHPKRQRFSLCAIFLGLMTDATEMARRHVVHLSAAPSTKTKATCLLQQLSDANRVTPADAAKLRGLFNWLEGTFMGKPLSGALSAFVARQYWEQTDDITEALSLSMRYWLVLRHMPARTVRVFPRPQVPVVIYTDASTEAPRASACRLGMYIVFDGQHFVASVDVPEHVMHFWRERQTYINVLELVAVPLLAMSAPQFFRGCDVIHFIDNQVALQTLIKAASRVGDINHISLLAGLCFAKLHCRPWYYWVPSEQNVSDPLSRLGFQDPAIADGLRRGMLQPLSVRPDFCIFREDMEIVSTFVAALG